MVRNDSNAQSCVAGRMPQTNEHAEQTRESTHVNLAQITDDTLNQAILDQLEAVAVCDREFAGARERLDAARRRLRELESEQRRRNGALLGGATDAAAARVTRKRSTTGMDAVHGRDNIDPSAALDSFRFLSLKREEIVLDESGDPVEQAIRFVDKDTSVLRRARTFGEARALLDAGHALGQPDLPLQRQVVWYVEQRKTGKLRLDQLFVEQRGEST
jgi:hypothetical protein